MRAPQETRFQSFMRQADSAMNQAAGIPYSEIQPYVEAVPGSKGALAAMREGANPAEFAAGVATRLAFEPAAPDANSRRAALAEFAAENPDWVYGFGGAVYRIEEKGLSRISPATDAGGRWGFCASHSSTGTLDTTAHGHRVPIGAGFEPLAGAMDIGDAVERLEAKLAPSAPGPSPR